MGITPMIAFPIEEYEHRVTRARDEMSKLGLDALLLHDLPSICYLSGYESWNTTGYYALLLPREGQPSLVLWKSEQGNALLSSWVTNHATFPTGANPIDTTIELLRTSKLDRGRVGIELFTPYHTREYRIG